MEGLGYPSAFFGAGAIPATERNITTYSHGRPLLHYVFLHISKSSYQANGSVAQRKRGCPGWGSPNFKATGLRGWGTGQQHHVNEQVFNSFLQF
jgi:hypothetical protein